MTTENTTLYPIATTYKYNGIDYPINFKDKINSTEISVVNIAALVQQIVNDIVDKDGFYPYFYDIALYGHLLSAFSDFSNTDTLEIDKILKQSDIKQVISYNIPLIVTVATNVDKCIEYQKQKLANKSEFDGLVSDLRFVFNKEMFEKISEKLNYIIDNIEPEAFVKFVKKFSDSKMTAKDLVSALVDAKFINKDLPKKKNSNKSDKGKIIDFKGQQTFEGEELKEDVIE